MTVYRIQWTIPYFTNMPSDVITNDFHVNHPIGDANTGNFDDVRDALTAFYAAIYTIGAGDDQLAPWCDPTACEMKAYSLNDPTPRAPRYQATVDLGITPATSSSVPLETAICLSFQGAPLSGTPQARRRGRVFLGGWAHPIAPGDSNSFPEVDPTITAGIAAEATTLATALATAGMFWVVWSRVENLGATVDNGWIDNALDTQRRREVAATARVTWP